MAELVGAESMATRKSGTSSAVNIDQLIDSSVSMIAPATGDWYFKLSEPGKSVADKVSDRGISASSMLMVLNQVMEVVCPEDVQYIPSESTIRKWQCRRRKTKKQ